MATSQMRIDDILVYPHSGPFTLNGIECRVIEFNLSSYHDDMYRWYGLSVPLLPPTWTIRRRAEFLYGRLCAYHAIRQHHPTFKGTIGRGRDGIPIWPDGFTGSISHTTNCAGAVVCKGDAYHSLGFDVESILDDVVAREISPMVLSVQDWAAFDSTCLSLREYVSFVFSAKESLFKALYPTVRRFFEFKDAFVKYVEPTDGRFLIRLRRPIGQQWHEGYEFQGRLVFNRGWVLTLICVEE